MKTYSNKSNARRAAIVFISKDLGISKETVRNDFDTYGFIVKKDDGFTYKQTDIASPSAVPATGLKIEKERPEQNGIVRPSAGGKCRQVWNACDVMYAKGSFPMPKAMRDWAETMGEDVNGNNAVIEMYQWRKFHGYTKGA